MKIVFVSAAYNKHFSIPNSLLKRIPDKIGLIATAQFIGSLNQVKKELENQGKRVFIGGQVLGCDSSNAKKIENNVDGFLFLGSGSFHVLGVALKLKKERPIFIFNPMTQEFSEFDWQEIKKFKQRQKAQEVKFLSSDRVGILVSSKSGQQNLFRGLEIKKRLKSQGKKAYLFLFDTLDSEQFENFSEIGAWVNTACPGIAYDTGVYNL